MTSQEQALALFHTSVLKQAKYEQISSLLDEPTGKNNLDLGGDNGVLSLLLRQKGGTWSSGDLDETTVASIRSLVGERVYRLDGSSLPFPDDSLDQIVLIDYLEHVADDRAAVRELRRILKPGGSLIVNVPHPRPGSLLTRLRHRIGLTDEWHGHLRPGYTESGLRALLEPDFAIEAVRLYSGSFSEAIDTALNGVYERLQRRKQARRESRKGSVITSHDMTQNGGAFRVMRAMHPVLWLFSRLDALLPERFSYRMIARARLVAPGDELEDRLERVRDISPAIAGQS